MDNDAQGTMRATPTPPDIPEHEPQGPKGGLKVPLPAKYSGKRGTLMDYIRQVELYMAFYSEQFEQIEYRNLFYLSYLEGDAFNALTPQLEEYIDMKQPGRMQHDKIKFANKNNYVRDILLTLFEDKSELARIERQLHNLQMKKSATEYTAKFQALALRTQWNAAAKVSAYHKGLSEEIKDELARSPMPQDFASLVTTVHSIDNRIFERRQERKTSNPHPGKGKKENVSATNSKPGRKGKGKGEGDRKGKKDLSKVECYGCHKKGHYKNRCPKKEQTAAVRTEQYTCIYANYRDCIRTCCPVHFGKQEMDAFRTAKLRAEMEQEKSWEVLTETSGDLEQELGPQQVAAANSEVYDEPDDDDFGRAGFINNSLSSDGTSKSWGALRSPRPVDNGETRSEYERSTTQARKELDEAEARIAEARISWTREEIGDTEERIECQHAIRISNLEQENKLLRLQVSKAEEYAGKIANENPMNALIQTLDEDETSRLTQNMARLALTFKMEEVFQSIAKEVNEGDRKGLVVIETIVMQEIRRTLQGDYCEDPLSMVHLKTVRGSRFLKNGSTLLPDGRLVPLHLKKTVQQAAKQIAELPKHHGKIPPEAFIGVDKEGFDPSPRSSKN